MTRTPPIPLLPALILLALQSPAASALDDKGAQIVIEKFLAGQKNEQGPGSAGKHVVADVDGDGKPDIVLLWDVMGPTSSWPKMTIFLDQGRTYRALTTDLTGQTQDVKVNGSTITVDTLTLGPKDARCCPSVRKQVRYGLTAGKLALLR